MLEVYCLAVNIYFEARSESTKGQFAVGHVVMNRVKSEEFPNTVCEVIKQKNQFSWYWDGKSDTPTNIIAWNKAAAIATLVYYYDLDDTTRGALYYHADWIPERHIHKNSIKIGKHIFY